MNALGWSTGLFVAFGAVWILIGALTPFFVDTAPGRGTLIFSSSTDTTMWGATPSEALDADANLAKLRVILLQLIGGLLFVGGILVVAVAWFGLRAGERWALATLSLVGLAALPYYALAVRPFLEAGTTIRLADVPPFMWVTTALWLPGTALGWLALRSL